MSGFGEEWVTFGRHRVLISVRDGFPGEFEREIAALTARLLDAEPEQEDRHRSHLVSVSHNVTYGNVVVRIGLEANADAGLISEEAETLYGLLWPADTINPLVEVLPPANSNSDHYHPAEHAARHMLGRERMGEY
jgi:hypothetical protein